MTVITTPALCSRLEPPSAKRSGLVMTVVHNPSDSRIWFREVDEFGAVDILDDGRNLGPSEFASGTPAAPA